MALRKDDYVVTLAEITLSTANIISGTVALCGVIATLFWLVIQNFRERLKDKDSDLKFYKNLIKELEFGNQVSNQKNTQDDDSPN